MKIKDIIEYNNGGTIDYMSLSIPQRQAYIKKYLISNGISDLHANAIIGNLRQENHDFDPSRTNKKSEALGIAQWLGDRKKELIALGNPNDINTQLKFLIHEINGTANSWSPGGKDKFFKSTDLGEATKIFSDKFERAGEHEKINHQRIKYAYEAAGLDVSKIDLSKYGYGNFNYQNVDLSGMNPNFQYNGALRIGPGMNAPELNDEYYNHIYKAELESQRQEQIKEQEEARMKQLQAELQRKQEERNNVLKTIPQAEIIGSNYTIGTPKLQSGGDIHSQPYRTDFDSPIPYLTPREEDFIISGKLDDNYRNDGTRKEHGFFGILQGKTKPMTEYAIGFDEFGEVPTFNPMMPKYLIEYMLDNDGFGDNEEYNDRISRITGDYGDSRMKKGLPMFATEDEIGSIKFERGGDIGGDNFLSRMSNKFNPSYYNIGENSFVMQNGGEIEEYDETDDYSEEYNLNGGEDKALNSFPIYKDTSDFIKRNKDLTTYKPKYENGKVVYSSEPLYIKRGHDYRLNNISSDIYDDNNNIVVHGEQCMASSCRAIDGLVGSGASYLQSSEETRKKFGIMGSTSSKPTEEEIANNPMYFDDVKFGSADAWDYAYMAGKNSPENVLFDAGNGERVIDIDSFKNNSKSYNEVIKEYDIPVGSFITLGYRVVDNDSTKVKGSSHTVRVVGYDENGEILISDMDEVKPLSSAMYIGGNLDNKVISSIITVPGKEKYTFSYFKGLQDKAKTKSNENYVNYKGKMPVLDDDGEVKYVKPSSDYKKYAKTISENKNYITAMLGMEDSDYDRYAKMALSIPALETNYGKGFMYKTGIDGDSTGLSQLVKENVQPKYKNILSKYKTNSPQHDALATLLYMKELDGYREKWVEQSKSETERPYHLENHSATGLIKDTARMLQGRNKGGFYKGLIDYKYKVDGEDIDIPSRRMIGEESDEEYTNRINEILKDKPDLRFEMVDRGGTEKRPTIYKKTKGNTIPEELEHMIGYLWQSPNSVKYGDAQGNNEYYKKYRKIYETLFNKK